MVVVVMVVLVIVVVVGRCGGGEGVITMSFNVYI